jgi:hypothetical protein
VKVKISALKEFTPPNRAKTLEKLKRFAKMSVVETQDVAPLPAPTSASVAVVSTSPVKQYDLPLWAQQNKACGRIVNDSIGKRHDSAIVNISWEDFKRSAYAKMKIRAWKWVVAVLSGKKPKAIHSLSSSEKRYFELGWNRQARVLLVVIDENKKKSILNVIFSLISYHIQELEVFDHIQEHYHQPAESRRMFFPTTPTSPFSESFRGDYILHMIQPLERDMNVSHSHSVCIDFLSRQMRKDLLVKKTTSEDLAEFFFQRFPDLTRGDTVFVFLDDRPGSITNTFLFNGADFEQTCSGCHGTSNSLRSLTEFPVDYFMVKHPLLLPNECYPFTRPELSTFQLQMFQTLALRVTNSFVYPVISCVIKYNYSNHAYPIGTEVLLVFVPTKKLDRDQAFAAFIDYISNEPIWSNVCPEWLGFDRTKLMPHQHVIFTCERSEEAH